MKYISMREQLLMEREKNAALTAAQAQDAADIEYIAMMCDVELDPESAENLNMDGACRAKALNRKIVQTRCLHDCSYH